MIRKHGRNGLKADKTRFAILGSGSAANGFIFEHNGFSILIDNGYTLTEFRRRMKQLDFEESGISFIFLTHHHSDHFKGVEALSHALNVPVVTHGGMPLEKHCKKQGLQRLDILPGKDYSFKGLEFRCFETSHDAHSSIGFHFSLGGQVFTLITDTGVISQEMADLAAKSDYLFLESNYSPEMLHNGPYPEFLKKRILSNKGHLSNLDAAVFMSKLSDADNPRLKKIFLCHLSEKNNTVEKVKEEVGRIYSGSIPYGICQRNDCLSQDKLIRSA
ncbi:MBL fold metallo-hydrolase [Oceanispirochaeta sp. M2]|uniref:MBL fold metallo-hydrolase n=1 Tax=Oceanispirochaeta sp. M2 TaxID=2735869 RepID=UPI000E09C370|nr:MBL fold metallo-hydrolase [Oceanispirochaeta sp. M2]MBF9014743.1 MBL fold metallo-hydrolase [Oceanispirochaeta sp. M2]RDG33832.1 MBL fold metallo-hydrolase [Oceanispirochaeta sp. M1]